MLEKFICNVKGIFNTITLIDLFSSIICVILGIVFFANSSLNKVIIAIIVGVIMIINGGSSIISYLKRGGIVLYNYNLVYGIIFIITGFIAFVLNKYLGIILGIYLIVVGIQKINYGILLKKFNESSWLLTLVLGLLFMVIAIILFFTDRDAIVSVTGITLFGYGLLTLINTILLRRRSNYFIA